MLERADTAEAIGLNQRASALLDQSIWKPNSTILPYELREKNNAHEPLRVE